MTAADRQQAKITGEAPPLGKVAEGIEEFPSLEPEEERPNLLPHGAAGKDTHVPVDAEKDGKKDGNKISIQVPLV